MSARLLVGGLELERAVIAFLVFHPQFDGMNVSWSRDTGKAERNTVTWPDILHAPSPFFHMQRTGTEGMRYPLADPGVLLPFPMLEQIWSQGLTDYRAFFQPFGSAVDPRLWPDLPSGRAVREGISVSFATTRADGFGEDERTTLRALASPLAVAVKVAVGLEMAETLLGTYLGATSGLSVLRREVRRGQGRVIHAVIWYSDLRGSTALAESLPLEAYLATLDTYFDCIPDAVAGQGGEPPWSATAGGMTF